jgi:hypothetical protein
MSSWTDQKVHNLLLVVAVVLLAHSWHACSPHAPRVCAVSTSQRRLGQRLLHAGPRTAASGDCVALFDGELQDHQQATTAAVALILRV